jgi:hypothetical protein
MATSASEYAKDLQWRGTRDVYSMVCDIKPCAEPVVARLADHDGCDHFCAKHVDELAALGAVVDRRD